MRITAVTCVKNEGPFLLEWIAFNRLIGVSDFLFFRTGLLRFFIILLLINIFFLRTFISIFIFRLIVILLFWKNKS